MQRSFGLVLTLIITASCSSGEVSLDPSSVDESPVQLVIPGTGNTSFEARLFFEQNLQDLMTQTGAAAWDTDVSIKGCIDAGCHAESEGNAQFFRLREEDEDYNWNYVGSRQFELLIGNYASSSSETLRDRNLDTADLPSLHRSFQNWTVVELCLLEEWTFIDSGENAPDPCRFE